ncbi:SGNH/GDSL hydrolase family protein [Bosea sp. (in: a-proteobacteria)]|uniref:SGNH/GDSL hydrolase family protein n=1 Tax=Bosea sp. (in: a-proteobacteria) TaxID=1871050 RepID=UPI001223FD4F|nr:SGNH/GDSL hydrolase family protein [Bosea sp. (in: a-proteobacteria)]TAJ31586.1 MAG: SGNH/GDSL hydrolase family protein [Bosea sp. (in: a-proteobacteria)]
MAASLCSAGASAGAADMTVVAFGTSLTARGGWPEALQAALRQCLDRSVAVVTVAQPGATSDWAAGALDRVLAARPDVVLVEMAANDAALHRLISLSASRRNMSLIFQALASAKPAPRVFNMAMSPVSGVRGLDRLFLDSYENLHRKLALRTGGHFIDHRPAWAALPAQQLRAAIPDGLHPVPGAAAEVMVPAIVRAITGRDCGR